MSGARNTGALGGRIGPRVARVVVDAMTDYLQRTMHTRARTEAEGRHIFWRDIAAERDAHLSPLYALLSQHDEQHPAVKQLLSFMGSHQGELAGMLTERAIGGAVATGIGSGLANLLAPINQTLMWDTPWQIPEPSTAAQFAVARISSEPEALDVIRRSGLNEGWGRHLIEASYSYPGLPQLIELWRRGLIDEAAVRLGLERAGVPPAYMGSLLALKREHLSPADAALAVLRGHMSEAEGKDVAAIAGLDAGDFGQLLYNTGEPPAAESMMEALRRGFIDDTTFDKAILQSRIRDEWIPVMKQLRYSPMATADAVEAVVRNYIDPAEGKAIAEQNGLEPEHWETLLLAHGRPPALGQMFDMLAREAVDEAEVHQAIRESDIKDKYIDHLMHLRWRIPPEHLIGQLVEKGGMSSERAYELLLKDRFEPDVAQSIVTAFGGSKVAKAKGETEAQVVAMYEVHQIDQARAEQLLHGLGYAKTDADLLLTLAELKREAAIENAAANAVKAAYLARHVTKAEAEAQLGALGLAAARVSYLLKVWDIELAGRRRTLTEPQIVKAVKAGRMSEPEGLARLEADGYSAADAGHLLAVYG